MKTQYIQNDHELDLVVSQYTDAEKLFIDTEFESYRGGTQLCLIQVSDGEHAFVIDAITIDDLTPLASALSGPQMQWVVHAGKQDVALLMKAMGLRIRPTIFDTQVAWSLLGPEFQVSLAYLEAVLLGLRVEKGHQTDNWKRRPLPATQLAYAIDDVVHLHALYEALIDRLVVMDRAELVPLVSREIFEPAPAEPKLLSLSSYRNAWQLNGQQRSVLMKLVEWYLGFENGPPRGTPHHKTLFSIAARLPSTIGELGEIKGVNMGWAKRAGESVLQLIDSTAADNTVDQGTASPPTPYGRYEDMYRDAWLGCARVHISAELSMAPEVAFPSWLMKRLRAQLKTGIALDRLSREFVGWRKMLAEPWSRFCRETSGT
ncbi:MAG: HRDC domain-containing protein [Myxococcota bacterium]|nr:HRDC domain-containing protein [Myxococcota bacterium]